MQVSIEALMKGTFSKDDKYYKAMLSTVSIQPIPNVAYRFFYCFIMARLAIRMEQAMLIG